MSSFTYEGDIELASNWLAFARSQQTMMRDNGSLGWNIKPEPDVLIMIRTEPEHIHIVVSGGNYHFVTFNEAGDILYFRGSAPSSSEQPEEGEEPTGISSTKAKIFKGERLLAPDVDEEADRHTWYGVNEDGVRTTVLSGIGVQYATNRFPLSELDRHADVYSSQVQVYKEGVLSYESPWATFNALVLDDVVIGFGTDGAISYSIIGAEVPIEFKTTIIGLTLPTAQGTDFKQVYPPALKVTGDGYHPYESRYASHVEIAGFEEFRCFWSFNKAGTKAVGVSTMNYDVTYHGYTTTAHGGFNVGDREPNEDFVQFESLPILVEADIEIVIINGVKTVQVTATNVEIFSFYNNEGFLVAADFYYYPPKSPDGIRESYEPIEDELILCFAERFNYGSDDRTYIYQGGTYYVNSDNSSIVIRNKSGFEYIRDMYTYNTDLATFQHDDTIPEWERGNVKALDLRSCSYVVNCVDLSAADALPKYNGHRVIFRGKEIYKQSLHINDNAASDNINPYLELGIIDNNRGNLWQGFWNSFRLEENLAANPFDDAAFILVQLSGEFGFIWDTYFSYNEETNSYEAIYQYHTKSEGSENPLLSNHALSSVWVI